MMGMTGLDIKLFFRNLIPKNIFSFLFFPIFFFYIKTRHTRH